MVLVGWTFCGLNAEISNVRFRVAFLLALRLVFGLVCGLDARAF